MQASGDFLVRRGRGRHLLLGAAGVVDMTKPRHQPGCGVRGRPRNRTPTRWRPIPVFGTSCPRWAGPSMTKPGAPC